MGIFHKLTKSVRSGEHVKGDILHTRGTHLLENCPNYAVSSSLINAEVDFPFGALIKPQMYLLGYLGKYDAIVPNPNTP
jgi:hypothetical protein